MGAQIKAGLRVAVQPHGGHFWSSMGQVQRPMDIVSLRIDNQVGALLDPVAAAPACPPLSATRRPGTMADSHRIGLFQSLPAG